MGYNRNNGKSRFRRKWLRLVIIVLGVIFVVHFYLTCRIHRFAASICENTIKGQSLQNADIVYIRDTILQDMKADLMTGYRISVVPYDALEFEFPRVTHTVYISTESRQRALRIRYDPFRDQFHIVGFWTIR
jgi:hypothetical protein